MKTKQRQTGCAEWTANLYIQQCIKEFEYRNKFDKFITKMDNLMLDLMIKQ